MWRRFLPLKRIIRTWCINYWTTHNFERRIEALQIIRARNVLIVFSVSISSRDFFSSLKVTWGGGGRLYTPSPTLNRGGMHTPIPPPLSTPLKIPLTCPNWVEWPTCRFSLSDNENLYTWGTQEERKFIPKGIQLTVSNLVRFKVNMFSYTCN